MSVINTNITSMIGQSNLNKSQNALQTSMERLSSGLRINSAKDDAAGQAIANRMTAQINGLAQAQRNANDGISVAQTAEGGLNQINDNLQRIRELTVQAANGTNSANDLQSIQDEVNQRLAEINRISEETDFNGTRVLSEGAETLTIQVGSQDGQTISVNLTAINAQELGLADFNVNGQVRNTVADASALEVAGFVTNDEGATFEGTVNRAAAEADLAALATSGELTALTAGGFVATANAEFANDPATIGNFVDGAGAGETITVGGVTLTESTGNFTNASVSGADAAALLTSTLDFDADAEVGGANDGRIQLGTGPFVGQDGSIYDASGAATGQDLAAYLGSDADTSFTYAGVDYTISNVVDNQVGISATAAGMESLIAASSSTVTSDFGYQVTADGEVQTGAGEAAFWDAAGSALTDTAGDITAAAGADVYSVDGATGAVTVSNDGGVTTGSVFFDAEATGLEALTTEDGGALTYYAIEDNEGSVVEYNTAADGSGDTAFVEAGTTNITTDEFGLDDDAVTGNPLAALDTALNQVDSLRSELGAVQNRFEDAINNLSTNETNLAAARSRIEDADYAVEVANMTRAQILQQAGTSVLAQANQIPQNVLSLLG